MKKITLLTIGLVMLGSVASASAQESKNAARSGYIGIRVDEMAMFSPAGSNQQVVVRDVSKGSPAEKVGVKTGDEIVRINGMSAMNGKFAALARTFTEGDTVTLRVKREGKEREFTLIAAPRPDGYASLVGDRTFMISLDSVRGLMGGYLDAARVHIDSLKLPRIWVHSDTGNINVRIERFGMPRDSFVTRFKDDSVFVRKFREGMPRAEELFREHLEGELGPGHVFRSIELGSRAIAGAEFADLDPAMKSYFGTDRGLLTLRVAPETPAARAGLKPGDIIVKANNREVSRVADLRSLLFAHPETLKLEVLRKGERKTLEVVTKRKGSDE
jgi:membrane-associated protease RseP (regulator of RpoE activity)